MLDDYDFVNGFGEPNNIQRRRLYSLQQYELGKVLIQRPKGRCQGLYP